MGGLRKFTDEGEMVPALEKLTVHWEKQIDTLIIVTHCGGHGDGSTAGAQIEKSKSFIEGGHGHYVI